MKFKLTGEDATHFLCRGCNGENHEAYEKAPVEIKHPLHPKHSLQLVLFQEDNQTRKCYCCDEDLIWVFYYCSACDYAMNLACVEKLPLLAIDHPKCHEHTLILFPRQDVLSCCNICALADPSSPIYMCPPCGFVVHKRCTSLPSVIKISRHRHRISFTASFDQGDWFCGICRREIDSEYEGYSCIKNGCSYAAHSRCATQSNVWDGKEHEGDPQEIEEEEVQPFVRISDGIIQHFSHEHHHLILNEYNSIDYDKNMECQACILPIYFGNSYYSCMLCDFTLHEACANIPRKMDHPIHPHQLTLVGENRGGVMNTKNSCSACSSLCAGFVYQCDLDGCEFYMLHVRCATISEPLVHETHKEHALFLTSKPGERRLCSVCQKPGFCSTNETFNCICDDFALCFACATFPQKVRYTDDKHMLTLSYGEESCGTYWCEICEKKLNSEDPFYMCNDYCGVTLHIECLFGVEFYLKLGSRSSRIES